MEFEECAWNLRSERGTSCIVDKSRRMYNRLVTNARAAVVVRKTMCFKNASAVWVWQDSSSKASYKLQESSSSKECPWNLRLVRGI